MPAGGASVSSGKTTFAREKAPLAQARHWMVCDTSSLTTLAHAMLDHAGRQGSAPGFDALCRWPGERMTRSCCMRPMVHLYRAKRRMMRSPAPSKNLPTLPPASTCIDITWCGTASTAAAPTAKSRARFGCCRRRPSQANEAAVAWIAEPPNGWIKSVLGFRQFSPRGLHRVQAEFKLVCLALNLRRMGTMKAG